MYTKNPITILAEFAANKYSDSNYPVGNFMESKDLFTMRKATQIADLIKNFEHVFDRAGKLFIEKDASGRAKKTIDHLFSIANQDPMHVLDHLTEDDYMILFDVAMDSYNKEDYDDAFLMMSALVAVFHNYIQPYIILVSITWLQQGLASAISLYEQLTKVIKNPLLYCCAADCYMTSEDSHYKHIAKSLLEEALELANANETEKANYKSLIVDMERMLHSC